MGVWLMYCLVMSSSYAGNLKAYLTTPAYSNPIDTLQQVFCLYLILFIFKKYKAGFKNKLSNACSTNYPSGKNQDKLLLMKISGLVQFFVIKDN